MRMICISGEVQLLYKLEELAERDVSQRHRGQRRIILGHADIANDDTVELRDRRPNRGELIVE